MTTLAQPHDCHSCNDERSIVQKKKANRRMQFKVGDFKRALLLSARLTC